jgi:mannosyltransferase
VVTGTDTSALSEQPRKIESQPRAAAAAPRSGRLRDALCVIVPALLAGALCLIGITDRSLGFDESATFAIVSQHGAALRHAIAHDGGNMSGYYVLLHWLVSAFGSGVLVLRLPSAIAVAMAVGFTGALARRLFDLRVALFASLITAVSLPLVFWGQSARSYALLVALVAGSFLAFAVLVDDRVGALRPRARAIAWAAYVLATALAMYMSLMAALALAAQLLMFPWWWGRHRRAVGAAVVAIAALCVPVALLAAGRGSSQLAWVSSPTLTDFDQVFEALTGAGLQPSIRATATTPVLLGLTLVGLLAVALTVARGLRSRDSRQELFGPVLLLSWLVVPVVLAWAESLVAQPLFLPRNLLFGAPAVAVLLAWGLTRPRVPLRLGIAGVALFLVLRALQLAPSYGVSPEDWKGATAYVLHSTAPGDCTVFYPADGRMGFQYYLSAQARGGATLPRPVLPRTPWSQVRPFIEDYAVPSRSALTQLPTNCPRVWLISSHQGRRHGSSAARREYRHYVQLRAALEREYATHAERIFGYASAVHVELLRP